MSIALKLSPEQILTGQLLKSLEAVKENLGVELTLQRGVHAVEFGGAHTIRVAWSSELNHFLVTTTSLVPIGMNASKTVSIRNASKTVSICTIYEVIDWLFIR